MLVVREGRIELPTSTLSRWHSTTELLPQWKRRLNPDPEGCQIAPGFAYFLRR